MTLGKDLIKIINDYVTNEKFNNVIDEMKSDWKWEVRNGSDNRSFMDRITSLMGNHEIYKDVMSSSRHTNFLFGFGGFMF